MNKEKIIEKIVNKPKYDSTNRRKGVFTDEIKNKIDNYLKENELKRSSGRTKQQMKAVDIHEELVEQGYSISYSTICNYVREKKEKTKEAYIRQEYEPEEIVEFDWGR